MTQLFLKHLLKCANELPLQVPDPAGTDAAETAAACKEKFLRGSGEASINGYGEASFEFSFCK